MGKLLDEHFAYVSWANYLHKLIEHVQEPLEDENGPPPMGGGGGGGGLSGEGNEGANIVFRDLRRHVWRKSRAMVSLRDVLWFHWLYTSPKLHTIAQVTTREYTCSECQQVASTVNAVNPIETIVAFMRRAIAFLSGPWAHTLRRKQRLYSDSRNFFVLSPLVLRVVSFESIYSALSDDV